MRVSAKIERGQGGRLLAPSRPTLTAEVIRSEEDAQKARGWGDVGWCAMGWVGLGDALDYGFIARPQLVNPFLFNRVYLE